jgi:hypothetical protein
MNTTLQEVPSWDDIKAVASEVDQLGTQTILRACDLGDMLREMRLTTDAKSFATACSETLQRSDAWANKLIVLSFRRGEVMKALADGTATDSIRSAYEVVKALPALDEEKAERDKWPRAKRGPQKGAKYNAEPAAVTTLDLEAIKSSPEYAKRVAEEKAAEERQLQRTKTQVAKAIQEYGTDFVQQEVDEVVKRRVVEDPAGLPSFTVEECRRVLQIIKHKPGWEDVLIRFQKQLELAKRQTRGAA